MILRMMNMFPLVCVIVKNMLNVVVLTWLLMLFPLSTFSVLNHTLNLFIYTKLAFVIAFISISLQIMVQVKCQHHQVMRMQMTLKRIRLIQITFLQRKHCIGNLNLSKSLTFKKFWLSFISFTLPKHPSNLLTKLKDNSLDDNLVFS